MPANPAKTLLSPDNHSLLMIDHQYLQMLTIRSDDASEIINHAVALVEAAAIYKVPMLTTTAFKERQDSVAPLAEATKAVKAMCPNCSATGHVRQPPNKSPNCSHGGAAPLARAHYGSGTC
jgi:nicotinamidase-related amidase